MNIRKRKKNLSCHSSILVVCNTHHHVSELTAGNIDINALKDDKYFPVELTHTHALSPHNITTKLTKQNLSVSYSHQKKKKKMLILCCLVSTFTDSIEDKTNAKQIQSSSYSFLILSICK